MGLCVKFIFAINLAWIGCVCGDRLVDMSHPFQNSTIYWPGTKHFTHTNVVKGIMEAGYWLELNNYEASEHGGTHMDAPAHFVQGRWYIDEIPLDRLISHAVVVDISAKAEVEPDSEVLVEDLIRWEEMYGRIPDGSAVFMNSDWARRWPNEKAYLGNDVRDAADLHFPGWSLEAVQWLTTNRKIHGVGTDTPSAEYGPTYTFPVHVHLLGLNLYSLENVNNLNELPPLGATVHTFPMKIYRGSGAPCRIVATIPEEPLPADGDTRLSVSLVTLLIALSFLTL